MPVLNQHLTMSWLKFHVGHLINFFQQIVHLGTQMKATGEIMAIGSNFEEVIIKRNSFFRNRSCIYIYNILEAISEKELKKRIRGSR